MNNGKPVNCLLPVIEAAFKNGPENRCRAFHCWKVLAENFIGEKKNDKRIRLLLIPLESNNAKVEEVALAKFYCWWHVIKCFKTIIKTTNKELLIKFLHFCFGNENVENTNLQLFDKVQALATQALLDIVGHNSDCVGCNDDDFPRLQTSLLTPALLTYNLDEWVYYLKRTTIILTSKTNNECTNKQITCIWKSVFIMISSMATNNIRKDLTCALLKAMLDVLEVSYIKINACWVVRNGW